MISDATTRVKLLSFVSQSGESQPRQNENIPNFSLPNFDSSANVTIAAASTGSPKVEFGIKEIRDGLKFVTEKGTHRYLEDHLDYIDSVINNLK